VPIIIGGIEASLRRIAHYDYWQDKVRRSILIDAKADLLLYGNAERALVEVAHRIAAKEPISEITDVRGTAFWCATAPADWFEIDSTEVDTPGRIESHVNPYLMVSDQAKAQGETCAREDEDERWRMRLRDGCSFQKACGALERRRNPAFTTLPLQFVPNPALQGKGKFKVPPRNERSVIRLPLRANQIRPGAVCACQPRAAFGNQPRQCARLGASAWRRTHRSRCVDQPAAHTADHRRDGPCV
jgi:hypothetical protein